MAAPTVDAATSDLLVSGDLGSSGFLMFHDEYSGMQTDYLKIYTQLCFVLINTIVVKFLAASFLQRQQVPTPSFFAPVLIPCGSECESI